MSDISKSNLIFIPYFLSNCNIREINNVCNTYKYFYGVFLSYVYFLAYLLSHIKKAVYRLVLVIVVIHKIIFLNYMFHITFIE